MAPTKNTLRVLIVCSLLLMLMSGLVPYFTGSSLPAELQAYDEAQTKAGLTWQHIGTLLIFLFGSLTASIGLLFFWRPARPLYLIMVILGLVLTASGGPSITAALTGAFGELGSILSGVILALIYFTPLKSEFTARRTGLPQNFSPLDRA